MWRCGDGSRIVFGTGISGTARAPGTVERPAVSPWSGSSVGGCVEFDSAGIDVRLPVVECHVSIWGHPTPVAEPVGVATQPSVQTLSRLLEMVSVEEVRRALLEFVLALEQRRGHEITTAALDGKTLRGVREDGAQLRALCVFSREGLAALDQVAMGNHFEEPQAAQAWTQALASNCPGSEMLTGDALYADTGLAQAIVDRGKDYTFKLKKPIPTPRRRDPSLLRCWRAGLGGEQQRAWAPGASAGLGIRRAGRLRRFARPLQRGDGQEAGQPRRKEPVGSVQYAVVKGGEIAAHRGGAKMYRVDVQRKGPR